MKQFIRKVLLFSFTVYVIIIATNYFIDPANLFHFNIVYDVVKKLNNGEIVENPGNMDEGLFQEAMISSLDYQPETVIVGSSHIMYEPWEFDNYYVAGLSGAYLGDCYALIGLLEVNDKMPSKIVIGVEPWFFKTDAILGDHASIVNYAEYEYTLILNASEYNENIESTITWYKKIKELFSFSYFQSSITDLKTNGIKYYAFRENDEAMISKTEEMGENSKIMPNGRRISAIAGIRDIETNNKTAADAIADGYIYRLETNFSELQEDSLKRFELLIKHLTENDVEVEFYLHPWYPSLYKYFEENESFSGVIKTEAYIRKLANEYNITVHGSYSSELVGMTEADFADMYHLKSDKMIEAYNIILE